MAKENILVVEDEEDIQELVKYNLSKEGYVVNVVSSGEEALEFIENTQPDLVLLDLMLPGIDGLEVCKQVKHNQKAKNLPIIIISAKGEELDVVMGLEFGADDYVPKPFSPRVLLARVKAVLRRKTAEPQEDGEIVNIHEFSINPGKHEVLISGKTVDLTYMEFKVLNFLARKPGWVFTRYQIIGELRGDEHDVTDRSIDVLIVGLRKKLGDYGSYIETVRGVGYRFKE